MKRRNHRREPRVVPYQPSADFIAIDQICRAAEKAGWPGRKAFECAVILRVSGVSVTQAQALFADAGKRLQ